MGCDEDGDEAVGTMLWDMEGDGEQEEGDDGIGGSVCASHEASGIVWRMGEVEECG